MRIIYRLARPFTSLSGVTTFDGKVMGTCAGLRTSCCLIPFKTTLTPLKDVTGRIPCVNQISVCGPIGYLTLKPLIQTILHSGGQIRARLIGHLANIGQTKVLRLGVLRSLAAKHN